MDENWRCVNCGGTERPKSKDYCSRCSFPYDEPHRKIFTLAEVEAREDLAFAAAREPAQMESELREKLELRLKQQERSEKDCIRIALELLRERCEKRKVSGPGTEFGYMTNERMDMLNLKDLDAVIKEIIGENK